MKKPNQNQGPKTPKKKHRHTRKIIALGLLLVLGVAYWYFFIHKNQIEDPYANFDAKSFYSNPRYRWKGENGSLPKLTGTLRDGRHWSAYYDITERELKMKRVTEQPSGKDKTEFFSVVPVAEENAPAVHDFVRKSVEKKKDYFGYEPTVKRYGKSVRQTRHYLSQDALKFKSNRNERSVVLYSTDNKNFQVIALTTINPGQKDKNYYNMMYSFAHSEVSKAKGTAYPLMHGLSHKWLTYGDAKKIVIAIHKDNSKSLRIAELLKATKTTREALDKEGFIYNNGDNSDDLRLNKNMVFHTINSNQSWF